MQCECSCRGWPTLQRLFRDPYVPVLCHPGSLPALHPPTRTNENLSKRKKKTVNQLFCYYTSSFICGGRTRLSMYLNHFYGKRQTCISFPYDVTSFIEFSWVHGIDDFAHLTRIQILEEIILHDCIFDQLLRPIKINNFEFNFKSTITDFSIVLNKFDSRLHNNGGRRSR